MSQTSFPNITPSISITAGQTVPLLLSSIALEELALAHILNAEAEKLQFVLGTLTPTTSTLTPGTVTISNLLSVDQSVRRTLQDVIKKEMLLEFKFENVLDLINTSLPPTLPPVLTIDKTDDPDPLVVVGTATLTYTITITNEGPSPATGVVLTDVLPPDPGVLGPTFTLDVLSLPPECTLTGPAAGGIITCIIGTLLPGESRIITFSGTVTSLLSSTLSNTAILTSNVTAPVFDTEETQVIVPI